MLDAELKVDMYLSFILGRIDIAALQHKQIILECALQM